jgi:hypothetical protein
VVRLLSTCVLLFSTNFTCMTDSFAVHFLVRVKPLLFSQDERDVWAMNDVTVYMISDQIDYLRFDNVVLPQVHIAFLASDGCSPCSQHQRGASFIFRPGCYHRRI